MQRTNRLFTLFFAIAVCVHIVRLHVCMLWLTKIMQRPAIARRALAVELLGGLDQTQTRRHRSPSLPARCHFAHEIRRRQSSTDAHPHLHRPEPLQLSPGLDSRLPQQSAATTAMAGSSPGQLVQEHALNTCNLRDVAAACPGILKDYEPTPAAPEFTVETDSGPRSGSSCTPPPSDNGASGSDTASTPGEELAPSQVGKPAIDYEDDAMAGAKEGNVDSPDRTLVDIADIVESPATPQYHRHRRNFSVDSTFTALRRSAPRTLRAQRNNNGGLLEFRASAAKPDNPTPTRAHRRNVSITLPIPKIVSQCGGSQHTQVQTSTSNKPGIAVQAELELQYKYRHIFIGTASLHDFLDILETSSLTSTTKLAVMKAFTILASKEQRLYRRSSMDPDDWDLVTRITPNDPDFDCITMARVRVGSISLQQFVDSIPFDISGETPTLATVLAFKNASRMDAEQARCGESKASAFRSWLLSQEKAEE